MIKRLALLSIALLATACARVGTVEMINDEFAQTNTQRLGLGSLKLEKGYRSHGLLDSAVGFWDTAKSDDGKITNYLNVTFSTECANDCTPLVRRNSKIVFMVDGKTYNAVASAHGVPSVQPGLIDARHYERIKIGPLSKGLQTALKSAHEVRVKVYGDRYAFSFHLMPKAVAALHQSFESQA